MNKNESESMSLQQAYGLIMKNLMEICAVNVSKSHEDMCRLKDQKDSSGVAVDEVEESCMNSVLLSLVFLTLKTISREKFSHDGDPA